MTLVLLSWSSTVQYSIFTLHRKFNITPGWLTRAENPSCCLVPQVPVEDDLCLPPVCADVRHSHDFCYPQVVLDSRGGCGARHCRQKLLVVIVSEVWLWALNVSDAEEWYLKRLEYLHDLVVIFLYFLHCRNVLRTNGQCTKSHVVFLSPTYFPRYLCDRDVVIVQYGYYFIFSWICDVKF